MRSNNEQYELVSSQDWTYAPGGQAPPLAHQVQPPSVMDTQPVEEYSPYSLANLDADWFPLLHDRLRGPSGSTEISPDVTDFGYRTPLTGTVKKSKFCVLH